MEKEFSAALHPTQYGNHIKDGRHRATHINPEVEKLVEQGYSIRKAYRIVSKRNKSRTAQKIVFDYDANTPKGEWV